MIYWKRYYDYNLNDRYGDRTKINCAGSLLWLWYFEDSAVNLFIQVFKSYHSVFCYLYSCLPTTMICDFKEHEKSKVK